MPIRLVFWMIGDELVAIMCMEKAVLSLGVLRNKVSLLSPLKNHCNDPCGS